MDANCAIPNIDVSFIHCQFRWYGSIRLFEIFVYGSWLTFAL